MTETIIDNQNDWQFVSFQTTKLLQRFTETCDPVVIDVLYGTDKEDIITLIIISGLKYK